MNNTLSALEIYMNKVFKMLMVVLPAITVCASSTITLVWLLGYYQEISSVSIVLFDFSTIAYLTIGILFSVFSTDSEGFLKPKVFFWGKVFLCFVEFLQWNFIAFMVPSRDYWAYSLFFVLLTLFFLDSKLTLLVIGIIGTSVALNWTFKPDELLPENGQYFLPDLMLRIVLLTLSFFFIWFIAYILETRLVGGLEKLAGIDTLTLLPNRRTLDLEFKNLVKNKEPFMAAMIDIDDFKMVNDTYGHDCGDKVLKKVANILTYISHDNGTAFRYGGEEFIILFSLGENEAKEISEKIRIAVEQMFTIYDKKEISVTITIGLNKYKEKMSFEELIRGADSNLYYGKKHGKNQVVF